MRLTIEMVRKGYQEKTTTPRKMCEMIVQKVNETKSMNIWIKPPTMENLEKYIVALEKMDPGKYPLWGVPFAIKDNIDFADMETTAGCKNYAYIPEKNATVVDLLIQAGAIPLGKTNLDQFATGLVGTRSLFGEVKNSYQEELISGGSSSGSAVSVAMGQAAFSLGTDTAGSGRVPAALNNLVGLKPSLGAWSTDGVVPACASLDCVTVFANNLSDVKEVNDVLRKYDPGCCWSVSYKDCKEQIPRKIYLPKDELTFYGPYADQYRAQWKRFVAGVSLMGICVEYIDTSLFSEAASILYDGPWIAERWAALGDFVVENEGKEMVPVTEQILRSGSAKDKTAVQVFQAIRKLAEIKSYTKGLLKDAILLMPTCGGTYTREQVDADPIQTNSNMGLYTNHCNLLNLSALAFPAGFACKDVPFGVTSFALAGEDGYNMGLFHTYFAATSSKQVELAVCGLHMRGMPLEYQLLDLGAAFLREDKTASKYNLYKLDTEPVKPGLVRQSKGGNSITVEIWSIAREKLGALFADIPSPLTMGKVELQDGQVVTGFVCEEYAASAGTDISLIGDFRKAN